MTFTRLVLAACLTLTLCAPALASAQTTEAPELEAEARARFSLGQLYYQQARFGEAATEFEAAYALHPHPLLLHNLYLARRDMGEIGPATDALTRYLAAATDLSASERRLLEGRLSAMRRQLDAMPHPVTPPEATPPEVTPPEVTPPDSDHEATSTPIDEPGRDLDPPSEPAAAHDEGLITGAIVSFSVAGAAVVLAAITGSIALAQRSDLASTCAPTCSDDQVSGTRTLGLVTDVGFGIAAAAAATAIVLTVLGLQSGSDVSVAPSVSADHAAIVVGGSF